MSIQELLYSMYIVDWMHMHMITAERQLDVIRRYYEDTAPEDREAYSLADYLNEFGYDGEMYACFEEFLECEYRNRSYIRHLCDNESMFEEYLATLVV